MKHSRDQRMGAVQSRESHGSGGNRTLWRVDRRRDCQPRLSLILTLRCVGNSGDEGFAESFGHIVDSVFQAAVGAQLVIPEVLRRVLQKFPIQCRPRFFTRQQAATVSPDYVPRSGVSHRSSSWSVIGLRGSVASRFCTMYRHGDLQRTAQCDWLRALLKQE